MTIANPTRLSSTERTSFHVGLSKARPASNLRSVNILEMQIAFDDALHRGSKRTVLTMNVDSAVSTTQIVIVKGFVRVVIVGSTLVAFGGRKTNHL